MGGNSSMPSNNISPSSMLSCPFRVHLIYQTHLSPPCPYVFGFGRRHLYHSPPLTLRANCS